MNQKQAFAAAAKLLGVKPEKVGMRLYKEALTGDEREAAGEASMRARAVAKSASQAREDYKQALLEADPEYQRLKQADIDARKAREKADALAIGRRITILRLGGMFNEVVAEGDNYADAIEQLKRKQGVTS